MSELRVLSVIPRWNYGGPTSEVLAEAARRATHQHPDIAVRMEVLALEREAPSSLLAAALKRRIRVHRAPDPATEAKLLAAADIVVILFFNTPSMYLFLERNSGRPLRHVLYSVVNGRHQPQRVPPSLVQGANLLLACSPHITAGIDPARWILLSGFIERDTPSLPPRGLSRTDTVHLGTLNVFKMSPELVPLHAGICSESAPLQLYGAGGDEERFQEDARAAGAEGAFRWHGYSDNTGDTLSTAKLFASPHSKFTYATHDLVIREAQASGVPTLLFRDAPPSFLIDHLQTGILADDAADYRLKLAAFLAGDLRLPPPSEIARIAAEQHDQDRELRAISQAYLRMMGEAPKPVDHGFETLRDWIEFQVGDPRVAEEHRRPTMEALRNPDTLLAHQRWACEGGLAQYINHFPELQDLLT